MVADEDRLVLVRQHRPGADGPVVELPAGKLEPGETPLAAAARELAEECGLAAAEWRTLGSFWRPAYSTERVTVLAGTVTGVAVAPPDGDEQIDVLRVPAADAHRYLEEATSLAALALHRFAQQREERAS